MIAFLRPSALPRRARYRSVTKYISHIESCLLSLLLIFLTGQTGCEKTDSPLNAPGNEKKQTQTLAETSAHVPVEIAPFDRYPNDDKFPISIRFDKAVAPADKLSRSNFENIRLEPARPGTWKWSSDSLLEFLPLDPWKPKESLTVFLAGLATSDGTSTGAPQPQPDELTLSLPPRRRCSFSMRFANYQPRTAYSVTSNRHTL